MKKMEKYCEATGCDMAVINKTRVKANEVSKMELIGDVQGKHVIVIDDIIDTATTLCKGADLLMEKGALSVTVFATHGVLSHVDDTNNALTKLIHSKIKHTYISNTFDKGFMLRYDNEVGNFSDIDKTRHDKITMLDITSEFASALSKIDNE
jgi:ribose-phosphate pyrophosphokinase